MRTVVLLLVCAWASPTLAFPQDGPSAELRAARERVERIEQAEGRDSLGLATALLELGAVHSRELRGAGARPVLERALAIREKVLGPDHTATAAVLEQLGLVLQQQGRFPEAREAFERALAIREKSFGLDHTDTLASVNELAAVLRDQGELAAARGLFERALASGEKVLGPRDPKLAECLASLSAIHNAQGRVKEARAYQERALAIREEALGPEALKTAESLYDLAILLQSTGEYARAGELYERAMSIRSKLLGPEHPDTAMSEFHLGSLLHAEGRFEEAQSRYEHALVTLESKLGSDHPTTLQLLGFMSELLVDRECFTEARPLLQRVLTGEEKRYGEDHPVVAQTLGRLADLLRHQGDFDQALPVYERAIAIDENVLGREHPQTAQHITGLASLLQAQQRFIEAEPLLQRALSITEKLDGADHRDTAAALDHLASCLKGQGKNARARPLFERELTILEKVVGPEHPDTSAALQNLGVLAHEEGDLSSARTLLGRALAIRTKVLGSEHPDTQRSEQNLILVLADAGEMQAAWDVAIRAARSSQSELMRSLWSLSERERLQSIASRRTSLEYLIGLAPSLASPTADREVYEAVLEWKGRVARSLLEVRDRVFSARGPAATAKLDELRGVQAELSTEVFRQVIDDRAVHEQRLARLRERRATLELALIELPASGSDPSEGDDVLRLVRALPEGSVLLDFFAHRVYVPAVRDGARVSIAGEVSEPRLTAWVSKAGADHPVRVDLGPAHVVQTAERAFLESLQTQRGTPALAPSGRSAFEEASTRLIEVLWTPVEAALGDARRVFVSPDRFLGTLPFETIVQADGTYLIEQRSFVYLLDGASLAVIAGHESARNVGARGGLLAVGGVDYNKRGDGGGDESSADGDGDGALRGSFQDYWERLRFSGREASTVLELYRSSHEPSLTAVELRGGAATEEALKRELPGRSYVHIATHGFFQPEGLPSMWQQARESDRAELEMSDETKRVTGLMPGLLSGLVCAGANLPRDASGDNGSLTAEEVSWLDLSKCDLVVLSACQPGLGTERGGEGLMSLQRAFQMAGAKTVVASLWSIDDAATADLMRAFYKRLWIDKQSKTDALRGAQLDLLKKNRAANQNAGLPYTWGAYVLSGDWR